MSSLAKLCAMALVLTAGTGLGTEGRHSPRQSCCNQQANGGQIYNMRSSSPRLMMNSFFQDPWFDLDHWHNSFSWGYHFPWSLPSERSFGMGLSILGPYDSSDGTSKISYHRCHEDSTQKINSGRVHEVHQQLDDADNSMGTQTTEEKSNVERDQFKWEKKEQLPYEEQMRQWRLQKEAELKRLQKERMVQEERRSQRQQRHQEEVQRQRQDLVEELRVKRMKEAKERHVQHEEERKRQIHQEEAKMLRQKLEEELRVKRMQEAEERRIQHEEERKRQKHQEKAKMRRHELEEELRVKRMQEAEERRIQQKQERRRMQEQQSAHDRKHQETHWKQGTKDHMSHNQGSLHQSGHQNSRKVQVATLKIPGYTPEELSVKTMGDKLVVQGKHICDCLEHCTEKEFQRGFKIPVTVDPSSLHAKLEQGGQLTITGDQYNLAIQPTGNWNIPVEGDGSFFLQPKNTDPTCGGRRTGFKLKKMNKKTGQIFEDDEVVEDTAYRTFEGEIDEDGVTMEVEY